MCSAPIAHLPGPGHRAGLRLLCALVAATVTACGGGAATSDTSASSSTSPTSGMPSTAAQLTVVNTPAVTAPIVTTPPTSSSTTTTAVTPTIPWGTPLKPFAATSPWNARPVAPVLGTATIPAASYFPTVEEGAYSTGVFVPISSDAPMKVYGQVGSTGIWDPDAVERVASVTVPRWPAATMPASGSDGHCEIVDTITGVVHSFWQLKFDGTVWRAAQHAWTPLAGRGWGDPAHYFQGARAAGVAPLGGLIRKHEVNDGDTQFRHALAVSLTFNALLGTPGYQFPATGADSDLTQNTGLIAEGALLMLPASFDTSRIADAKVRKVAETLKTYGAYVVDRNTGTPFAIYAEIGSSASPHATGWNQAAAVALDSIRQALRPVASASSWLDGNGKAVDLAAGLNLLSLRGPWSLAAGTGAGGFNTLSQRIEFNTPTSAAVTLTNANGTGFSKVRWAPLTAGNAYTLTARASGGAKLRLQLVNCSDATKTIDTGNLGDGQAYKFTWPATICYSKLYAVSGVNQVSSVGAELKATP